ncbi:MAG: carbohydrate binding family 9 domain-containing protein, partial [Fimbriimonas ginsengisoli]|nr:carbohydrate binding family 9 domain-containing protein [Fimbriimonas ginsengisoli]
MSRSRIRRRCLISLIAACAVGSATSQPAPERNPSVAAMVVGTPPKIDGLLDDATWAEAPRVQSFYHELAPAAEKTTVCCCYDRTHLYFAFECEDPDPASIRGQQKKRNGKMEDEDTVTVGIDALADHRTMYWFTVNPLGTQSEEIPGGAAAKIEWRGDWQGAAHRNQKGWTAEMAIPFEVLRYPPGQRKFGLIFRRHVSRTNQESAWPIRCNYYTRDNQATWENLETPRIQRRPRIMPYTIVGAGPNLRNDAGVDIKYNAENNITGLFSFRPDFQTIEDVIDTIDFSYNPRRLA